LTAAPCIKMSEKYTLYYIKYKLLCIDEPSGVARRTAHKMSVHYSFHLNFINSND